MTVPGAGYCFVPRSPNRLCYNAFARMGRRADVLDLRQVVPGGGSATVLETGYLSSERCAMNKWVVVGLVCLCVVAGCKKEEPPPPPPPPPPPSAEQLREEALKNLADILMVGMPVTSDVVKMRINDTKAKLRAEVNGDRAIRLITSDVREALKSAKDAEAWDSMIVLGDAWETLEPQDSRIERYREQALGEKNKPKVTVKGFYEDVNTREVTVFLEVFLPDKYEVKTVQVRQGDEFVDTLKFVDIVGDRKGVKLQYLPTGEIFEVLLREKPDGSGT